MGAIKILLSKLTGQIKVYVIFALVIIVLGGIVYLQSARMKSVKADRDTYKQNTQTLLGDIKQYQTKDSLNAVSIGNLELSVSQYKKYREEDYKVIESLKIDKKRLEQITTAQTQTIYDLKATVHDSIVYVDSIRVDTLRCFQIREKWFDMTGCTNKQNEFTGKFENRDSLIYVEHIIPKKFLFFKWGVKERRQDIISKNPFTKIVGAEYTTIRD